jgi:hypothetical protein
LETNLSEEQPDVIIIEWSCLPTDTAFWGMHAWTRLEKRGGSENISDLNLSNASFTRPREQRLVNSSLYLETESLSL